MQIRKPIPISGCNEPQTLELILFHYFHDSWKRCTMDRVVVVDVIIANLFDRWRKSKLGKSYQIEWNYWLHPFVCAVRFCCTTIHEPEASGRQPAVDAVQNVKFPTIVCSRFAMNKPFCWMRNFKWIRRRVLHTKRRMQCSFISGTVLCRNMEMELLECGNDDEHLMQHTRNEQSTHTLTRAHAEWLQNRQKIRTKIAAHTPHNCQRKSKKNILFFYSFVSSYLFALRNILCSLFLHIFLN